MQSPGADILLAPDVYVNASVALGSAPEHVVRRVLGQGSKHKTTEWVVAQVEALFLAVPSFKKEAVKPQMDLIKGLLDIRPTSPSASTEWLSALVESAKAIGVARVVTDHPDLADTTEKDGIAFCSSDAWLLEQQTPPPPPPGKK